MRMMIFRVIVFLAVFIFMQGAILPWAISNDTMPLWADIILISIILLMWLVVIDRFAYHLLKILRTKDDETME